MFPQRLCDFALYVFTVRCTRVIHHRTADGEDYTHTTREPNTVETVSVLAPARGAGDELARAWVTDRYKYSSTEDAVIIGVERQPPPAAVIAVTP